MWIILVSKVIELFFSFCSYNLLYFSFTMMDYLIKIEFDKALAEKNIFYNYLKYTTDFNKINTGFY